MKIPFGTTPHRPAPSWCAAALAVSVTIASCATRPPIDIEVRGGSRSGVDWWIGFPF